MTMAERYTVVQFRLTGCGVAGSGVVASDTPVVWGLCGSINIVAESVI